MTDFKMVPIRDIRPDPNQPRKIYDETAMAELTASVKEKGVLQPILLRPNGKGMILVCGERRFRASKEAGLTEIPSVIRKLTDDEALELQIIENLQRKDVHPMEEAVAFKSLKERFSIEDIALKVGKPASFVAQRIKLTDMIQDFQDMLYMNKLTLKDAVTLCRLPASSQKEVLKELTAYNKDWRTKASWTAERVSGYTSRSEQSLDKAPFKTTDATIYPEAGACTTCQYNSAANQLLFPEMGKKRICHNPVCFNIKAGRGYQAKVKEVISDPDILLVSTTSYLRPEQKGKVAAVEELGGKVLGDDLFKKIVAPEPVEDWEIYLRNWHVEDDDDIKACKEQYADDRAEYDKELADYNELIASGRVRKAFVVAGYSDEGKIIDITLKTSKKGKAGEALAGVGNADLLLIDQEIDSIKQRDSRNKELDREKVYKRLVELLKLEGNDSLTSTVDLSPDEWAGLLFALCDNSYAVRNFIDEQLEVSDSYEGKERYDAIYKNGDTGILVRAMRRFIHDKLINLNECDYAKRGKPAAIYEIGKQYFKKELATFELEQTEKATRRAVTVKARLKALEEKRNELLAKEPVPAAPKKSSKKAKA